METNRRTQFEAGHLQGFDPTYKGWKQSKIDAQPHWTPSALILPTRDGNTENGSASEQRFRSFDPTYKGWKRKMLFILDMWMDCFDPTYKGWKHPKREVPNKGAVLALILPTRDGNSA